MRKFIKVNDYPVISHQSWLPWPPLLLEHNKYFNFPQKEKRDFGNQRFSLPKGYNQAGNRPSVVGWIRKESHHILDGVTELWALSMYGTRWWQSHMGWGQTFLGATLFFFIGYLAPGWRIACLPSARHRGIFQFVFRSLPPDDHCLFLMLCKHGRISNFRDMLLLLQKTMERPFLESARLLLQAVTKDFSSVVITTLISPDLLTPHPSSSKMSAAKAKKSTTLALMMIFLHIPRKIRRRRNFHWWQGATEHKKLSTGQFEVWWPKCDH